jgi:hypothetical protein
MRIGWDIDGVGYNFTGCVKEALKADGKFHLWKSGPNPPYWEFYEDWGWTGKDFVEFCGKYADAGIIFAGDVLEGYAECIKEVAQMGHEIIIATDRTFGTTPEVSQKLTVEWLEQHGIEYDELHFTADKTDANCDFFIEDKLENYDALIAAGTNAYLLNRPWNQISGGDGRMRIDNIWQYADAIVDATIKGYTDLALV